MKLYFQYYYLNVVKILIYHLLFIIWLKMNNNGDWRYEDDDGKMIVVKPKCVKFVPGKKASISHYLTIDDLRVKSDTELDMNRKQLFNMGKYDLEEGELFE
jgi:hypothetical protein